MTIAGTIIGSTIKIAGQCGIGTVIGTAIRPVFVETATVFGKVCVATGGMLMSGAICVATDKYVDNVVESVEYLVDTVKKMKEEKKTEESEEAVKEEKPNKEKKEKKSKKKAMEQMEFDLEGLEGAI